VSLALRGNKNGLGNRNALGHRLTPEHLAKMIAGKKAKKDSRSSLSV